MFDNYQDLLNIKLKKYPLIIVTLVLIIFVIFVLNIKIYSVYESILYCAEGKYFINIPIKDVDKINNANYVMVNNQKYDFKILNISELLIDEINLINYQKYQISMPKKLLENEIVKIKVYYQEERIIKKIT